jgi:membrane-bound metal-dependent hydrolase YbcI (DUF457 family)
MDVVTHGMMGVVIAAPFAAQHPEAAVAFMFGSVIPDGDALARMGGKRGFLKCHQTYTHALPIIVAVSALAHWGLSFGELIVKLDTSGGIRGLHLNV